MANHDERLSIEELARVYSSSIDSDEAEIPWSVSNEIELPATMTAHDPSGRYERMDIHDGLFRSDAVVAPDGRIDITLDDTASLRLDHKSALSNFFSSLDWSAFRHSERSTMEMTPVQPPSPLPILGPLPKLSIVIQLVGSRGDIQPFIALARQLHLNPPFHRVRIATHPVFKEFVKENGLEFFSVGGDPASLMAYMVKNPGLLPGLDSLKKGDVGKRRKEMYQMFIGFWRSCIESGDGMGEEGEPFVAECIIANPPSFAHIHCAEKLGIPLHMMFTMPWSPTYAFPHPLANVKTTGETNERLANLLTYSMVETLTWQGLGDLVNRFREKTLGLEPVSVLTAPGIIRRLKVPHTYCWSPALIARPRDWGPHISIAGFFNLAMAASYQPPKDLVEFLDASPTPPVYIGFGSIVIDDPRSLTVLLLEAIRKAGVRALISTGWGGLSSDSLDAKDVYFIGNCPHDWLFDRVSAVVHHGGAGTTAIGIAKGRPTVVVPFFGDQPFWGDMVARAKAGPHPIPFKHLTSDNLAEAIRYAVSDEALKNATALALTIGMENGIVSGAESFHRALPTDKLRCMLCPDKPAAWRVKRTQVHLSAFAASVLAHEKLLKLEDVKLYQPVDWNLAGVVGGPTGPLTGAIEGLAGTVTGIIGPFAGLPSDVAERIHEKRQVSRSSSETSLPARPHRAPSGFGSPTRRSTLDESTIADYTSGEPLLGDITEQCSRVESPAPFCHPAEPSITSASSIRQKTDFEDVLEASGSATLHVLGAIVSAPMNFFLSMAEGFHNLPRLYGDTTVRSPTRITGFKTGLVAAGKEIAYGVGDGVAGLVRQPYEGAKKEGFAGFWKGFGKGIGGFVFKPVAAVWGLEAYTMKGLYMEVKRHRRHLDRTTALIEALKIKQGVEEWEAATLEQRAVVVTEWKQLDVHLKRDRHHSPFRHHRHKSQS